MRHPRLAASLLVAAALVLAVVQLRPEERRRRLADRHDHGAGQGPADRVQRPGQQPRRLRLATRRSATQRVDHRPSPTTPTASTSTPRSASSPTARNRFIAGEDTGQTKGDTQGWGIFQLERRRRRRPRRQRGRQARARPTRAARTTPRTTAAASSPTGASLTTDVGNQALGAGRRPAHRVVPAVRHRSRSTRTARSTSTSPPPRASGSTTRTTSTWPRPARRRVRRPDAGVWRYSPPFPTGHDAAGGCGKTDGTGAPMADTVNKEMFIAGRRPTT